MLERVQVGSYDDADEITELEVEITGTADVTLFALILERQTVAPGPNHTITLLPSNLNQAAFQPLRNLEDER